MTALHLVCYHGDAKCLAILLSTPGIDINLQMQDADVYDPPLDDDYYSSVSALSLVIFHHIPLVTKTLLAHPLIQVCFNSIVTKWAQLLPFIDFLFLLVFV